MNIKQKGFTVILFIIPLMVVFTLFGLYQLTITSIFNSFSINNSSKYSQSEVLTYPVNENAHVSIITSCGSVSIIGWEQPTVSIEILKKGPKKKYLEKLPVDIEQSSDYVTIKSEWDSIKYPNCSVNYKISIPKQATQKMLKTHNGSIRVEDIYGQINAKSENGTITIKAARNKVYVTTSNGKIKISQEEGSTEQITAHTSNGSIVINNAGGPVETKTSNGSITIAQQNKATGTIDAKTSNGSIIIHNAGGPVTAYTTVGKIYISKNPTNTYKPKAQTDALGKVIIETIQ